jgi:hypothetical protein
MTIYLRWASRALDGTGISVKAQKDLQSGVALIRLVEQLFHEQLDTASYHADPDGEGARIRNFDCAIDFIRDKGIPLQNLSGRSVIHNEFNLVSLLNSLFFDCYAKRPPSSAVPADQALLHWVQSILSPYNIAVQDWHTSWSDGLALYSLVAEICPVTLDFAGAASLPPVQRVREAMAAIQESGIPLYLDPSRDPNGVSLHVGVKVQVQEIYNVLSHDLDPDPVDPDSEDPAPLSLHTFAEDSADPDDLASISPAPLGKRPPVPPLPRALSHLPPDGRTEHALGIDVGSSKIRIAIFSSGDTSAAFDPIVFDSTVTTS